MDGSLIFIRNEFKRNDPGTWMSLPIRSVLNIDNVVHGESKMYYNHIAIYSDGYVYETGWNKQSKGLIKGEVIKTPFVEWRASRNPNTFQIKRPKFILDSKILNQTLEEQLGKKYDFTSVILAQPSRQLFSKRVWIGSRTSLKKLYCSELCGYALYKATDGLGFANYYELDPEDLYLSPLFKK